MLLAGAGSLSGWSQRPGRRMAQPGGMWMALSDPLPLPTKAASAQLAACGWESFDLNIDWHCVWGQRV